MAIKAYFINGFDTNDNFINELKTNKRETLLEIPDVLQYNKLVNKFLNFNIFMNSFDSYITVQEYGVFDSYEEAYKKYYNDYNIKQGKYDFLYLECISNINKLLNMNIEDTEWCMLICVDKTLREDFHVLGTNKVVINSIDYLSSIQARAFFDSCFIYNGISRVRSFCKKLTTDKRLSRFDQYLIAHYSQELYKVNKPQLFLTNKKELDIYKVFYEEWALKEQLSDILGILNQSVSNYTFLWQYKEANSQKISNSLLSLFTVIVSYSSLEDSLTKFFNTKYVDFIFFTIIAVLIFRICYINLLNLIDFLKYKNKKYHHNDHINLE